MPNFITALFLTFLSLFSLISSAEIPLPPKHVPPLIEVIAKKQPDSELSILGITIGKTTLDEVKSKFKSKDVHHEGDAGESLYVLCYKISNGSTIAFESGEMGGRTHIVSSVSINGPKEPYRLNKVCEKTSLIKKKLVISGINLGMSPDLIKRLKGKPSKQSANSLFYQYEVQDKSENGQRNTVSTLGIEFNQDSASAIRASKEETY